MLFPQQRILELDWELAFDLQVNVAERDQMLYGPTLSMLWFQCPELCEFRLPGRPRRTKEGELKVRTHRVVEGGQTRSADFHRHIAGRCTPFNHHCECSLM